MPHWGMRWLWMMLAPLFLNAVSLLVMGWMARQLGQSSFGLFALAYAYADLCTYLTSLGLSSVSIREIAREPQRAEQTLAEISLLRLLASLFCMLVLVLFALQQEGEFGFLLCMAALTVPLRAWIRCLLDALAGLERQAESARCELIGGLLLTACSMLALWASHDLFWLSLSYVLGPLCSALLLALQLQQNGIPVRVAYPRGFLRARLRQGLPFFASGVITTAMYRLDSLVLATLHAVAQVGVYAAVNYQIIQRLRIIPETAAALLYPRLSRAASQQAEVAGAVLSFCLLITLPIAVGALFLSEEVVVLLLGREFQEGAGLLRLAAWTLPLWGLVFIGSTSASARGQERRGLVYRALSGVLFISLLFGLCPTYKGEGAIIALLCALCLEVLLYAPTLPWQDIRPLRLLGAQIPMGLLLWKSASLGVGLRFLLAFLCYALSVWLFGFLRWVRSMREAQRDNTILRDTRELMAQKP